MKVSQGTSPTRRSRTRCEPPSPSTSRCSFSGASRWSSTANQWSRCASRCWCRQRDDGPAPFVFQKTIDDVLVSITVGLNTGRSLGDDDEDDSGFERDRSSATAGWTVLCNDRAVIVGDKSRLTGWGDGIPLYHPQFAIITGIIEFRSKRADKLPVTTTKRALDTSSNVWLESLVKMKEGMRIWISYTNQWKNHPRSDQSSHWEDARPLSLSKAIEAVALREDRQETTATSSSTHKRRRSSLNRRTRRRPRGGSCSRVRSRRCGSFRRCCSTTATRSRASSATSASN